MILVDTVQGLSSQYVFTFGVSQILYCENSTSRRCRQWFGKERLSSTPPRRTSAKQRQCLMGGCSEVGAFHKENNSEKHMLMQVVESHSEECVVGGVKIRCSIDHVLITDIGNRVA